MTDKTMTLEQVRDWHLGKAEMFREEAYPRATQRHQAMADAITRHISQPAERGEAVARCCEHSSDCAVHNAPALPVGPCDCKQPQLIEDDIHWFEEAFQAWECGDTTGVVDALNDALKHFTNVALPPAAGVPDAWPKLELWFFRNLSSAQRLSLLNLHGFPVDEIGESHVWQKNALRQLLSATPSPTIDVAAVREVMGELSEWGKKWPSLDAQRKKLARSIGDAK